MPSSTDVEVFLGNFQTLGQTNDVFVLNRPINTQGLLELGLTAVMRREIILSLRAVNYVSGPSPDVDFMPYYVWVFGSMSPLDSREIYIKLSDRIDYSRALCLSFHPSRYPLSYPLRVTYPLKN